MKVLRNSFKVTKCLSPIFERSTRMKMSYRNWKELSKKTKQSDPIWMPMVRPKCGYNQYSLFSNEFYTIDSVILLWSWSCMLRSLCRPSRNCLMDGMNNQRALHSHTSVTLRQLNSWTISAWSRNDVSTRTKPTLRECYGLNQRCAENMRVWFFSSECSRPCT